MKNAEMLTRCHAIAATLEGDELERYEYYRKNPEILSGPYAYGAPAILAGLIRDLERDINAEECRAAGRLSPLKAAQRVLKSAQGNPREALHGAWITGGMQCLCDGYRAFRLAEHLPGLPSIRDGVEPINVDKYIDPARDGFTQPLQLPDLADIKSYVKAERARRKGEGIRNAAPVAWDFGEGLPYVNAQYLIDALELLPGCTCRISAHRPELGGLYLESPAGDGLLLSCRRPTKHHE